MPDGTLIQNIPDGTSKEEITRKWENKAYADRGIPTREEDREAAAQAMAESQRAAAEEASPVAAFQSGAGRLGRGLLQMALPQSMEQAVSRVSQAVPDMPAIPDFESGEFYERDRLLAEAHPKSHIAGEVVPTLAASPAGWLGGAAVGGLTGAGLASPEERGTGATGGVATSLLTNALLRTGGRVLGPGIGQRSQAAQEIQEATGGKFIPLRESLDRMAGGGTTALDTVYGILENLPFAGKALARQSKTAQDDIVEQLLRTAEGGRSGTTGLVRSMARKGRPATAADVAKIGQRAGAGRGFQELAESAEQVFDVEKGASNLARRAWTYDLIRALGAAGEMGALGVPRGLTAEVVQNSLTGNTALQKAIAKALEAGDKAGTLQIINSIVRQSMISEQEVGR
jgi:hypothetical protein